MYLTDKQINTVAKLMAQEIPKVIHTAYLKDRAPLGIHETVEEALIRKMNRVPGDATLPTILGSMILECKTPFSINEFNALDKELTVKFNEICDGIVNDTFLPGITMQNKVDVLEFITEIEPKKIQEYVDVHEDDIALILKNIHTIIDNKIQDFEL